jgi:uncharacterized protein (DUF433 family)
MPREYTPQEAAVLAGAKLGAVQKAITNRAIDARVEDGRRLLKIDSVYTIALATSAPPMWKVSYADLKGIVRQVLTHPGNDHVPLDRRGVWTLNAGKVLREVGVRMRLYERAQDKLIERNPDILGGTPVIKGTRLNVYAIAGRIEHGETIDELVQEYPSVTREQLEAAQLYAKANPLRGRPGGRPWEKSKKKSRGS